jgi:triacylglycerol lipase
MARLLLFLLSTAILWAALPIRSDSTSTQPTKNETVVLLHGLIRSERSMRRMEQALQAEGYRVINHDYPSTSAPIAELTDDIFKALTPQIKDATTLHFVTHSMGGIILRQRLAHHTLPNLGRTVMLAPPSQGSEVPDKLGGNFIYNMLNGPAGNELGTGTNSLPRQLGPPTFELGIIAGDRTVNPILSLLIPGPDDGKVALARVKPPALTDFILIHATHTFMAKNQEVIAQTKHFLAHGQFKHEEAGND